MQQDANLNSEKLAKTEKKFDDEKEERQKMDSKLESLCTQLFESELRYKDVLHQLQEKDIQYSKFIFIQGLNYSTIAKKRYFVSYALAAFQHQRMWFASRLPPGIEHRNVMKYIYLINVKSSPIILDLMFTFSYILIYH